MFLHTFCCNKFITLRQMSSIAAMIKRKCINLIENFFNEKSLSNKKIFKGKKNDELTFKVQVDVGIAISEWIKGITTVHSSVG